MKRAFLISAVAVTLGAVSLAACGGDDSDPTPTPTMGSVGAAEVDASIALANPTETSTGLKYEDIIIGNGATPALGKQVSVHYTGWLTDGTKFDSSHDRGAPITYVVGEVSLIDGWEEGLASMREGGKRRLEIPGDLGYGPAGRPPTIPPDATLIFELELIDVTDP